MRWLLILAALLCGGSAHAQMMQTIVSGKNIVPAAYVGPGDLVSSALGWYGLRGYSAAYAATGTGKAIQINSTTDVVILTNGNLDIAGALASVSTSTASSCTISGTTITCSGFSGTPGVFDTITGAGISQPCFLTTVFSGSAATAVNPVTGGSCGPVASGVVTTFKLSMQVTTIYDQSGSGHDLGAATAGRYLLIPSCLGSLPCMVVPSSAVIYYSATISSTSFTTMSHSWVADRTGNPSHFGGVADLGTQAPVSGFGTAADVAFMFSGTVVNAAASDNAWHAVQAVFNGASSVLNVDGSSSTVSPGTVTTGQTTIKWGDDTLNNHFIGASTEMGMWPVVFTSPQISSMHTNQSAYWGTP